jgi:hypothetical protein
MLRSSHGSLLARFKTRRAELDARLNTAEDSFEGSIFSLVGQMALLVGLWLALRALAAVIRIQERIAHLFGRHAVLPGVRYEANGYYEVGAWCNICGLAFPNFAPNAASARAMIEAIEAAKPTASSTSAPALLCPSPRGRRRGSARAKRLVRRSSGGAG